MNGVRLDETTTRLVLAITFANAVVLSSAASLE